MNIREFDVNEFGLLETEWEGLLSKTHAHPLFLSWAWMYSWWNIYSNDNTDKLALMGVFDDDQKLILIAPLFIKRHNLLKGWLKCNSVRFIGSNIGFRTEYLQFIVEDQCASNAIRFLLNELLDRYDIDEFSLNDIPIDSLTYKIVRDFSNNNGMYGRVLSSEQSYSINCNDSFESYVSGLGKNTRLKVFNRRKNIKKMGDIEVSVLGGGEIDKIVKIINEHHRARWGGVTINSKHIEFLSSIKSQDIEIRSVVLSVDGADYGCTLDIIRNNTSNNMQSGFLQNSDNKISIGTLLFGYAIEHYCNSGVLYYDLLAGGGKNSDYKKRIADGYKVLESVHFIHSKKIKLIYYINDKAKAFKRRLTKI